jgi:hypothetical protein
MSPLHCGDWSDLEYAVARLLAGRFVISGDCWEFNGYRERGYGRMKINGRLTLVHRHVLSLKLGRPIQGLALALHRCHNPPCFYPDHLYEGSAQDNADDRGRAQCTAVGERASKTKLTEFQVVALRKDRADGMSYRKLSTKYGISHASARNVALRRSWCSI